MLSWRAGSPRVPRPPSAREVALRRLFPIALALVAGCGRVVPADAPLVLPEHYTHSIAALGMPGARRAFQVGHGSVIGSGDAAIEWRIVSAPTPVRVSPVYFERDGVPVAHWWMVGARESVHFEAAAVPRAALGDSSLMLSVLATATWTADAPGELVLEARLRTRADPPNVIPWDAADTDTFAEAWRDRFAIRNGQLVAGVDPTLLRTPADPRARGIAATRGPGPGILGATGRVTLARGEQHRWHYWMPAYPSTAPGPGLERVAGHDAVVGEARATWRGWLARGAALTLPDTLALAAYRAALVTLIASHERDQDAWVPLGNPFQYRDVWLRDGARVVRALAVAGYTDLARSDAWTLTHFQLPSGVLLSQQGQLDGIGQGLWALAQVASLFADSALARRALPVVTRALGWLEVERLLTRQLGMRYEGLLPYGDPRDNELARAQLVGNDAWGIAGCRAAATLARLARHDSLARAADAAAADYQVAFARALARSGSRDVPGSWQGTGRDWGNLATGYPTRVIAPEDPRLMALARRIRARAGGTGLVSYGPPDSLHSYLGADLAQWSLLAGRPAEARVYLADLIARSSSTLGQAEIFGRINREFGINLPPHATAAATLVDLMRNMIVCDVRDTLELGLGGDPSWWRGTRFEKAPTRFGMINVALETPAPDLRHAQWGTLAVPVRVWVPDGERVLEVLTDGAREVGERWIECPAGIAEVRFRVAATGAGAAR